MFLWVVCAVVRAVTAESVFHSETRRIAGLDPAKVGDLPSIQAVSKVYEGLVQYAYLDRPYRVEPCLAESLPEVSPDGKTYTFHLRKGICFQDDRCFVATAGKGRELVASDFVYSLKRVADLKTVSPGYWVFRGRIDGLDAFREQSGRGRTDYDAPVAGLEAVDRYTLRIHLVQPCPAFVWILTMNYAYAVPREAVEFYGDDFVSHPVGTGPYCLVSHIHNYRLEYVRNPKWGETRRQDCFPTLGTSGDRSRGLLADAGRPLPLVDRIIQYVVTDASTQWLLFLSGELDVTALTRDNWDAVIRPDGTLAPELVRRGIVMESAPSIDTAYVGFNMEDPVLGTNRFLRQAMMSAFDRDRWVSYQNGRVTPATGPVPPSLQSDGPHASPFPFDLARAQALMVQAGYSGGRDPVTGRRLELTLELGSGESETREMAEVLASFMDRIGIVLKPSFNNWPAFLKKIGQRRAQMFYLTWAADYPDPENFLQLFYGPNRTPGANRCNFVNGEFDQLYERAARLQDGPEKTGVYDRMESIVKEECPWIFLHHSMSVSLRQPWLANFKPHDFPFGLNKYYRINPKR